MSDERATPEQGPESAEYRQKFRESVTKLIKAGKKRCHGLIPEDVVGVYFSAGVTLAERNLPGFDMAAMLREIADDLDEKKSNRTVN